jgi:hypothetical protein
MLLDVVSPLDSLDDLLIVQFFYTNVSRLTLVELTTEVSKYTSRIYVQDEIRRIISKIDSYSLVYPSKFFKFLSQENYKNLIKNEMECEIEKKLSETTH